VPTKMPKGRSGVQVVFNFTTVMNIAPMTGSSVINLVNSGVANDDKGKPRPTITVQNPGNIHAKLTDATITLSGSGWSKTMSPDELRPSMGLGLVQPAKTRRFLLPVDLPPNVKDVIASIRYKPTK
jgi:fimbrial chaperone protein